MGAPVIDGPEDLPVLAHAVIPDQIRRQGSITYGAVCDELSILFYRCHVLTGICWSRSHCARRVSNSAICHV
ncbi:hypothetical protein BCEP4_410051 [Burkholderia cepacia]|nr:hypothetical protein BCEP4_410051 [Burkholderia cepacia]